MHLKEAEGVGGVFVVKTVAQPGKWSFTEENIRKYGFAFEGKKVLIG